MNFTKKSLVVSTLNFDAVIIHKKSSFHNPPVLLLSCERLFANNANWNQQTKYLVIHYACCQNIAKTFSELQITFSKSEGNQRFIFFRKTMNPFNPRQGCSRKQ